MADFELVLDQNESRLSPVPSVLVVDDDGKIEAVGASGSVKETGACRVQALAPVSSCAELAYAPGPKCC